MITTHTNHLFFGKVILVVETANKNYKNCRLETGIKLKLNFK